MDQYLTRYVTNQDIVIHGGARGADKLAGEWCQDGGIACAIVPAQWYYYRKSAGPVRNEWMMRLKPDLVIAFPGGTGTANMIKLAEEAGVEVIKVEE
jgi:ABC-type Fe3+-hydroxamate transport system substrate-binding protein